ncbi:Gfo/Idh/MocA family protein [Metabacillus idriensis]|uniref:Gfo/Idh/MocA family protein n=1 Tax=Metabacillus idriensis TaxID=324768 RepID=UPI00174C0DE7|nr:Gfo/Idh/MocA family oxidoreductase [Metabacillus idriensis]
MKTHTIAIVGAGSIFQHHVLAISNIANLELVAVADLNSSKSSMIKECGLNFYTNYKVMVHREKPDAVIIALLHYLHKQVSVWCANQGCHLLVEKPMAISYVECEEIMRASQNNKVVVMVANLQQYFPENIAVKDEIKLQQLGPLMMIHDKRFLPYFHEDRPGWFFERAKAGGGIFMNLGAHSIDKIQMLTDSKVKKVYASLHWDERYPGIEGGGLVSLRTESGIPATISLSGYQDSFVNETELIFLRGIIKLQTGAGAQLYQHQKWRSLKIQRKDPFTDLYNSFLHNITSPENNKATATYAMQIMKVIECIYNSDKIKGEITL